MGWMSVCLSVSKVVFILVPCPRFGSLPARPSNLPVSGNEIPVAVGCRVARVPVGWGLSQEGAQAAKGETNAERRWVVVPRCGARRRSDLTEWRQDEDGVFFYIAALPQNATDEQTHAHRKLHKSRKRNAESQQQKKLKRQAAEQEPAR